MFDEFVCECMLLVAHCGMRANFDYILTINGNLRSFFRILCFVILWMNQIVVCLMDLYHGKIAETLSFGWIRNCEGLWVLYWNTPTMAAKLLQRKRKFASYSYEIHPFRLFSSLNLEKLRMSIKLQIPENETVNNRWNPFSRKCRN